MASLFNGDRPQPPPYTDEQQALERALAVTGRPVLAAHVSPALFLAIKEYADWIAEHWSKEVAGERPVPLLPMPFIPLRIDYTMDGLTWRIEREE